MKKLLLVVVACIVFCSSCENDSCDQFTGEDGNSSPTPPPASLTGTTWTQRMMFDNGEWFDHCFYFTYFSRVVYSHVSSSLGVIRRYAGTYVYNPPTVIVEIESDVQKLFEHTGQIRNDTLYIDVFTGTSPLWELELKRQ